jgi:hypothetical protein
VYCRILYCALLNGALLYCTALYRTALERARLTPCRPFHISSILFFFFLSFPPFPTIFCHFVPNLAFHYLVFLSKCLHFSSSSSLIIFFSLSFFFSSVLFSPSSPPSSLLSSHKAKQQCVLRKLRTPLFSVPRVKQLTDQVSPPHSALLELQL